MMYNYEGSRKIRFAYSPLSQLPHRGACERDYNGKLLNADRHYYTIGTIR